MTRYSRNDNLVDEIFQVLYIRNGAQEGGPPAQELVNVWHICCLRLNENSFSQLPDINDPGQNFLSYKLFNQNSRAQCSIKILFAFS